VSDLNDINNKKEWKLITGIFAPKDAFLYIKDGYRLPNDLEISNLVKYINLYNDKGGIIDNLFTDYFSNKHDNIPILTNAKQTDHNGETVYASWYLNSDNKENLYDDDSIRLLLVKDSK